MPGILDQVARSAASAKYNHLQIGSPDEFFALQLAVKLNEPSAARHYVDLLQHYSVAQLLTAFRRVRSRGSHQDPARSFHEELRRLGDRDGEEIKERRLAAIRVHRRAVAVVILTGNHLEYPPLVRQLTSDSSKAESSAAGFIHSAMQKCPFRTAALEVLSSDAEVQRQRLTNVIQGLLSDQSVGIWQVQKREVLAAFGYPPIQFRSQVHKVIEAIWPDMNGSFAAPLVRDALALGLYCQTEYLFNL
jgi:hypothetical protein